MKYLITQAFVDVDFIGPHVQEGHYDLIGPSGEIIPPSTWQTVVEPGWAITMHMWPLIENSQLRTRWLDPWGGRTSVGAPSGVSEDATFHRPDKRMTEDDTPTQASEERPDLEWVTRK